MTPLTLNQKCPSLDIQPLNGPAANLKDFDQKSALVVINAPDGEKPQKEKWAEDAVSRASTWNWLGLKVLVLHPASPDLPEGAHLIDRWNLYFQTLPLNDQVWKEIEKEYIYREAKHC